MLTELRRIVDEQNKNLKKETENRRKCQIEVTELKNIKVKQNKKQTKNSRGIP